MYHTKSCFDISEFSCFAFTVKGEMISIEAVLVVYLTTYLSKNK